MNILILTGDGCGLGLAQRLALEGHKVSVHSRIPLKQTGKEIYEVSDNLLGSIKKCQFIIADCDGWGNVYAKATTYNKPIIGASLKTDMMNNNAVRQYKIAERFNIKIPETELFSDAANLYPKILEWDQARYFIKYENKVFEATYNEWMAWALYKLPFNTEVLLQKQIYGHTLAIQAWFNGMDWVKPNLIVGPDYDKIGGSVVLAEKERTKLTADIIEPMGGWLRLIDYKGPITVKVLVTKNNVYAYKFEAGLSFPLVYTILEGIRGQIGEFFSELAFGIRKELGIYFDYLVGVNVSTIDTEMFGAPILGVEDTNLKHIFLQGALQKQSDYIISGEIPFVYAATAHGRDLGEACNRMYRTISKVEFPRMKYVPNLEPIANQTFERLRSWNYL